jgi:Domain of unknown function (DUF5666)
LVALPAWSVAKARAEDQSGFIEGYVTSVHFPTGFEVDGEPVTTSDYTTYTWYGGKAKKDGFVSTKAVQVGAYVQVTGDTDKHVIAARSVLIRDDADRELWGSAVVEGVIAAGAEPVFQADGFRIRIVSKTDSRFKGNLKNLADVKPNSWIDYAGRRGPDGVLVAVWADFSPGKLLKVKTVSGAVTYEIPFRPKGSSTEDETALGIGGDRVFGGTVQFESWWHTISTDRALQDRVNRVGTSLIPAFQKQMAANDPAKIPFRFYAFDADNVHGLIETPNGLVLVPQQVVERFQNDDQLAAILADAVAFNIEHQGISKEKKRAEDLAMVAAATLPVPIGLVGTMIAFKGDNTVLRSREALAEQRGRVALALMADAGYDPWAAPDAWRLVTAKKLPTNLSTLPYPSLSGYQIHFLSQQYQKTGKPGTVLAAQR